MAWFRDARSSLTSLNRRNHSARSSLLNRRNHSARSSLLNQPETGRATRCTAWWVVGISGIAFVVLAGLVIPWDWLPGGHLAKVAADDVFTAKQIHRAEQYSGAQWELSWWSLGVSLLVAVVLGLTPWGARLVRRLPGRWWSEVALGTVGMLTLGELVTLPFAWRSFRIATEYGLTNQSLAGWLRDQGVSLAVSWVFTSIGLLVLIGIARRLPRRWPAVAALAAAVLVVLGSFVYPVLIEPLYNDFRPLHAGPLRTQITELADREDVRIDDVLVSDASRRTTSLNAYVSGFGSTRRVVLYDTLIDSLPRDQVLVVVAHELAHAKHHDVPVGTALGALGSAFGVGLLALLLSWRPLRRSAGARGLADPAVVPLVLLLLSVGTLVAAPLQNTISRAMEAHADLTSLEVTGEEGAFVRMQRQLASRSLADPTPPAWRQWWFGTHPTTLQRIGMAEGTRVENDEKRR